MSFSVYPIFSALPSLISKTNINWQVFIFASIKCMNQMPLWSCNFAYTARNKMSLWRCEYMTMTFLIVRNHTLALFINSHSHSCLIAFPYYRMVYYLSNMWILFLPFWLLHSLKVYFIFLILTIKISHGFFWMSFGANKYLWI